VNNRKHGCSLPDFAHMPCCILQLSLLFYSSSEPTLCSPHDEMNEYNSPSFATVFQHALLNTCITTCFGLAHSFLHAQQDALTHNKNKNMMRCSHLFHCHCYICSQKYHCINSLVTVLITCHHSPMSYC
jgi:hypothetical protein